MLFVVRDTDGTEACGRLLPLSCKAFFYQSGRGGGKEGGRGRGPVDLLCSRNARPQKALVGRAQWEIKQALSLGKMEIEKYGERARSDVLVPCAQ